MADRDRDIRWGIIGSGNIADRFLRDLPFAASTRATSIWGRNRTAVEALAFQHGVNACNCLDDLLRSDVDAVYIATLPDTHAEFSGRALEYGKAVLCEKPAAMSLREVNTILALAKQRGLLFMEAMKPPFFPVMKAIEQQLQCKPLGPVAIVQSGFAAPTPADHTSWLPNTGGGSLAHIGVYHAWLAVHWLGAVQTVYSTGRVTRNDVDSFAACLTTHAGGGIAQFFSGLDVAASVGATVAGQHGTLYLEERWWSASRARIIYRDGDVATIDAPYQGDGLHYEVAHFCDLLRNGATESLILSHEVTRQIMRLLDDAQENLRPCAALSRS